MGRMMLVSSEKNVFFIEPDEREKREKIARLKEYIAGAQKEIRTRFLIAYMALMILVAALASLWWYGFFPILPRAMTFQTLRVWTTTPAYKGPVTYMFIGAASAVLANQLYRSLVHRYHIWQMTRQLTQLT